MDRIVLLFIFSIADLMTTSASNSLPTNSSCIELGDCVTECKEKCGCDRFVQEAYTYNETTEECQINFKYLLRIMVERYNTGEKIREEANQVFKGILVAALIFIVCACTCTLTACFYCCRINYYDYKLQSDIDALSKKLGRDKQGKVSKIKPKSKPEAESCTVVCEDAGVFVC